MVVLPPQNVRGRVMMETICQGGIDLVLDGLGCIMHLFKSFGLMDGIYKVMLEEPNLKSGKIGLLSYSLSPNL